MSLTRAAIEQVLVLRAKKRMAFVGMDITTSGSNPDLVEPISTALMLIGIMPANIAAPSSSEIASVASENMTKLFDLAEARLLENIFGNADKVTLTAASGTEQFGQFTQDLEKAIARKQAFNQRQYGVGNGSTVISARKLG
jgi:hypothetical protein